MGTIVGLDANYKASTNMEAAKCIIISNKRNPTEWGKKKGVEVSYFDMFTYSIIIGLCICICYIYKCASQKFASNDSLNT